MLISFKSEDTLSSGKSNSIEYSPKELPLPKTFKKYSPDGSLFKCIFSLFVTLPLFIEIPSLWRGDTHSFLAMGCNSYQWFLLGKIDYQPLRPPFYSAFVNFFSGIWNLIDCREIGRDPMSFFNNAIYDFNFMTRLLVFKKDSKNSD